MASVVGQDLQKAILTAVYLRDFSLLPATCYLGLGRGALPTKTTPLVNILEVAGPGYARISLPNNSTSYPSLVLSGSDDWKITSVPVRYANTGPGDWTAADYAFLTDVATGTAGKFYGAASINPFLLRADDTYDLSWEAVAVP